MGKSKADIAAEFKERNDAIENLKSPEGYNIQPGTDIYAVVKHVSSSNMSRGICLYMVSEGRIVNITFPVAKAAGYRLKDTLTGDRVLHVDGCGMDMCFAVVYNLGRTLFPEGGPIDKSTRRFGQHDNKPERETDGGYLLNKRDL